MRMMKLFEDFNPPPKCKICGKETKPLTIKDSMFGLIKDDFCEEHLKKEQLRISRKLKLEKINEQ